MLTRGFVPLAFPEPFCKLLEDAFKYIILPFEYSSKVPSMGVSYNLHFAASGYARVTHPTKGRVHISSPRSS